ncbi:hypothetical protein [Lactococcus allomyrinae]|uniref:Uncharacterized protein n=1 Tax=Lactococcus allomyrinae TaxID=2419773 RepID=A0A387BFT3_9LACT|nr:hypothetical protein [Lactococcus allomyrinae]AYF99836.1 hypothetical protein D7I46_01290 [Lactococcus allomyrinae]
MNQLVRTVKRYPFQVWAVVSNLGVFAWLQANTGRFVQEGKAMMATHQSDLERFWNFLKENPLIVLGIAVILVISFHFLENIGRTIFTLLNLLLLLKILGVF